MQKGKFNTIVDSAWGSSAKGAVSCRLADIFDIPNLSSGNFPNAGHTALKGEVKFVAKALPTGAILPKLVGKRPTLWVGPNSGFQMKQLHKELEETGYRVEDLEIHERAIVVEDRHIEAESPTGSQSTLHISSTMSGSGAAFTDKAMRGQELKTWGRVNPERAIKPMAFMRAVRAEFASMHTFLHEVSQGFALSVNYGTHYPHCTFRDCTPQQAYADFGILPEMVGDVYLNVRSFPIRVGSNFDADGKQIGYSGDVLDDQKELTWEQVGREAGMPESEIAILAERERTTVTKKIRRVFTPSWKLLKDSADFCGATKLVLNFPQYIDWSSYKVRGGIKEYRNLHKSVRQYVDKMQEVTELPVAMIGSGPDHEDYIWLE
jgi:adenylosuccinate synthase